MALPTASDNVFPKLINSMNASDPAAPSDSSWKLYAKADGIYARSSNAIVGPFISNAGAGMANPLTTEGDSIQSLGGTTPVRLAIGSNGTFKRSSGSNASWARPPGFEFDYAQTITNTSPTATTEATANTVVTGNAVTYDGATTVMIEFYTDTLRPRADGTAGSASVYLYDGAASIGRIGIISKADAVALPLGAPVHVMRRLVPSAGSHTYSIRVAVSGGTGLVSGGVGGLAGVAPAFIRITKAN